MLDIQDYEKINAFKDALHKHALLYPNPGSFRNYCSSLLDQFFGYKYIVFGYLPELKKKTITLDLATYNISMEHIQRLFSEKNRDILSKTKDDIIVVSSTPELKYHFKPVLRDCGFADQLTFFLFPSKSYIGYLSIYNSKKRGTFGNKDCEIINKLRDYIAIEYFNYVNYFALKNLNQLLTTHTNYFPVGLIIVQKGTEFLFFNEYAKSMLDDLNIGSPNNFLVFYNNVILPQIRYSLKALGRGQLVKYRNYRFSVVASNPYFGYENSLSNLPSSIEKAGLSMGLFANDLSFIYCYRDDDNYFGISSVASNEYKFTPREREITELLLEGKNRQQLSELLNISSFTVNSHLQNIYKKTNSSGIVDLLSKLNHNTPT